MPIDVANFLAQTSPRFNPTMMERDRLTNTLAQSQVDAMPQQRRMADLEEKRQQQLISQGDEQARARQLENARGVVGRFASIVAESPRPLETYGRVSRDPTFLKALEGLGYQAEQAALHPNDTDDSVRQQAQEWRQIYGPQGEAYTLNQGDIRFNERNQQVAQGAPVAPPKPTDDIQEYQVAREQGFKGTFFDYMTAMKKDDSFRDVMALRKEFEDSSEVKNYRSVLPLFQRRRTAPNDRAGDISVIYALGKMFDPTSVVREGELQLSMNAAPWLQKMAAAVNSQITGEGRLNPEMRAEILGALRGQVDALKPAYEQERGRYGQYAKQYGFTDSDIVGPNPAEAFAAPQAAVEYLRAHPESRPDFMAKYGYVPEDM